MEQVLHDTLNLLGKTQALLAETDAYIKDEARKTQPSAEAQLRLETIFTGAKALEYEIELTKSDLLQALNKPFPADDFLNALRNHTLPDYERRYVNMFNDFRAIISGLD